MIAEVTIAPLASAEDANACATIMSSSEPWVTLERGFEQSLGVLQDPAREVYVAKDGDEVVGFVVLVMQGAFVGYIQSVATRDDRRGRGVGSRLIAYAEERIFRVTPNVFICASSFNPRAQQLYQRLGYRVVGELTDYIVAGHSEWLLRKTIGPLTGGVGRGA
jgi:ribosomal protein S18 acetylase RimI-like enzyme